jgi:hypothetical protein
MCLGALDPAAPQSTTTPLSSGRSNVIEFTAQKHCSIAVLCITKKSKPKMMNKSKQIASHSFAETVVITYLDLHTCSIFQDDSIQFFDSCPLALSKLSYSLLDGISFFIRPKTTTFILLDLSLRSRSRRQKRPSR